MISFNGIPTTNRVPIVATEFDNSRAVQGPATQVFKMLIIGLRLSTGTVAENIPTRVTSKEQGRTYFGAGSMLAEMIEAALAANSFTELWAIASDENGAGVKAAGKIVFAGTATAAGTFSFYIGDKLIEVAVAVDDDGAAVATALAAAIEAEENCIVDAAVDGSVDEEVDITFKHKATIGNYLPLKMNYQSDQELPAGITATITQMAGGTTAPTLTTLLAALNETQYHVIAHPYTDATSLAAIEAFLLDRFGPLTQIEGVAFTASNVSHGNLSTLGLTRNSPHSVIFPCTGMPTAPWKVAAALAGVVAYYAPIDPARPLQTLELPYVLPPLEADQFNLSERNILLYDGISTYKVDSGGKVRIERLITTYRKNDAGADDTSYLDVEVLFTLSYLRYTWNNMVARKYPRYKLAGDGIRIAPGQAIVTPKTMKAEAIALFSQWEELGIVENIEQFKEDLIVEKNSTDPNRLDVSMSPDLVNQFRILGSKIQFLL
jgi:phage tail sheath gpL-like